jgi:tetratricopeptide (TPR) repeat protein
MKTSLVVAALFPLLAICRPAFAAPPATPIAPQPTPEQVAAEGANKLRDQGNEAMLGMRYSDALASYQQAIRLSPESAGLHYSIARAYQFLGEYPEALGALESFEKYATPETKAKVGKLDALYAQIRPRISTLKLTCSAPGARVLLRDKVIGTTPLPPTRLPSGAATIQIELDGFFPESRDVVLPGGGELAIEVTVASPSARSWRWMAKRSERAARSSKSPYPQARTSSSSDARATMTRGSPSCSTLARREKWRFR